MEDISKLESQLKNLRVESKRFPNNALIKEQIEALEYQIAMTNSKVDKPTSNFLIYNLNR